METKNQKNLKMNSLYFNRYLLLRYLLAGYFFANLYWILLLSLQKSKFVLIPIMLLIFLTLAVVEQIKKYHDRSSKLSYTKCFFRVQSLTSVIGMMILCTNIFSTTLFPFVNATGRSLMMMILIIGLIGCLMAMKKIQKIENNTDKYYLRIQTYLNSADMEKIK